MNGSTLVRVGSSVRTPGFRAGAERIDELTEASNSEAPHEHQCASVPAREAPRLPDGAVTVDVRYDDQQVRTLHERFERARPGAREVPSMAFERVPTLFRDHSVVRARAIQTADDSDMHGRSIR